MSTLSSEKKCMYVRVSVGDLSRRNYIEIARSSPLNLIAINKLYLI